MTIPLLISGVSLVLSLTVAWLTLLRRGTLGMTQPMLIGFLHEAEQPKIFFRAMLYATGKRGHIIEALYLKVRRGESTQTFNFWMYGETKDLKIGSGLRVGEDGVSFNHHFLPPRDASSFAFLAGEYTIEVYARILNRHAPLLLSIVKLSLDFGIMKWPTSAVCFGPPLDTANFYSGCKRELGSGGGCWTGEPRWSCSSRFGWSMSSG